MAREADDNGTPKMKRKAYEKALARLQEELCWLQDWVKFKGLRVIIVFEGRDAAGKGGTIKAITERVSPASSASWPCRRPRTARRARCTCNAICNISRRRGRSSCLTVVGTTARASSMSWDSAHQSSIGISSPCAPRLNSKLWRAGSS